jgi:predicted transcriptional regulator
MGGLEAEVLNILESKERATVSDITLTIRLRRDFAYTTIAKTLDRLYKKRLVERRVLPGRGGAKYLYCRSKDEDTKRRIVEASIERLTRAFGSTAYYSMYKKMNCNYNNSTR